VSTHDPCRMTAGLSISARLRWPFIRQELEAAQASSVVEVGCGKGALGEVVARRRDYRGYEPDLVSFRAAERAIRRHSDAEVRNETIPRSPDRRFDAVVACEVLEHIEDDLDALVAWREWLVEGGSLIITVPAWKARFGAWDERVGHFRRYERAELADLLEAAGFKVERIVSWGFPLGYLLEAVRNVLAGRRRVEGSMDQRTAESGRQFQPSRVLGFAAALVALPARGLQYPFRNSRLGIGFVAVARRRSR
jgi:SAM-dependent methyltransferase